MRTVLVSLRKILMTDTGKCTMAFKKWREKGESIRVVDRYRCIEGRWTEAEAEWTRTSPSSHVRKKQGYENEDRPQAGNVQSETLSDLKHDLFFWKAYLSIKQPFNLKLTAHGPIHPQVLTKPAET
jgi:hypothetical protein